MSPRAAWISAALLGASGVMLLVAAGQRDARLNVPPAIAVVAAVAFLLGAGMVPAAAAGRTRLVTQLVVLLLATFATIGGWIAIGSGSRECTPVGIDVPPGRQRPISGTECRVAFGTGALLCAAIGIVAVRQLRKGNRQPASIKDLRDL